jgi:hypothetical protein
VSSFHRRGFHRRKKKSTGRRLNRRRLNDCSMRCASFKTTDDFT